jgi:hypothetical protein
MGEAVRYEGRLGEEKERVGGCGVEKGVEDLRGVGWKGVLSLLDGEGAINWLRKG